MKTMKSSGPFLKTKTGFPHTSNTRQWRQYRITYIITTCRAISDTAAH